MYVLITTYDDGFVKSECPPTIQEAFGAASIYAIDEECVSILCIDTITRELIINFIR